MRNAICLSLLCLSMVATYDEVHSQWVQVMTPSDSLFQCIAVIETNLFVGTWGEGVFRSADNGGSWMGASNGLPNLYVRSLGVANFSLFAGVGYHPSRSTDNGSNWTSAYGTEFYRTYCFAPGGRYIFAGTWWGGPKIMRSSNDGLSWERVWGYNAAGESPGVYALVAKGAYIFGGLSRGSIMVSADTGATWQHCVGLPDASVSTLASIGQYVFAGLWGAGVYRSSDNGQTWVETNNGLANLKVSTVYVCGGNLLSATSGGVFISTDSAQNWRSIGLLDTTVYDLAANKEFLFARTAGNEIWRRPLFDIFQDRSLTLICPKGGEVWPAGSMHHIMWASVDVTKLKIEYSTDGGASWSAIETMTSASSGSYLWTIPNTPSAQCRVRISDVEDNRITDISGDSFAIVPPCPQLSVPLVKQTDPPWNVIVYDHLDDPTCSSQIRNKTIGNWGCALTSAAMVLQYYGILDSSGNTTTPSTLNQWLKDNNGYSTRNCNVIGSLDFAQLREYSKNRVILWDSRGKGLTIQHLKDNLDAALDQGFPAILHVRTSGTVETADHFVVATGRMDCGTEDETYVINDPSVDVFHKNTLAGYGDSFDDMRILIPVNAAGSAGLSKSFQLLVASPVELLIRDSEGRRLGYDLNTDSVLNEIQNGGYFSNNVHGDTDSGNAMIANHTSLFLRELVVGKYLLDVIGTGTGEYALDFKVYDSTKGQVAATASGSTTPGMVLHYSIEFSDTAVKPISVNFTGVHGNVEKSNPTVFTLSQNYPNPFNPSTTIHYGLPHRSDVHLSVFNTLGQQVATLQNGEQEAGYHDVKFDGTHLPSGIYFYRMQAGSYVETRKLLLLK
jgi:hypothetical protein